MSAQVVLDAALEYAEAKKQLEAAVRDGITVFIYEERRDNAVAAFDKALENYVGKYVRGADEPRSGPKE